jgi:glycosyltransferase involved in cell wall biosynthesis
VTDPDAIGGRYRARSSAVRVTIDATPLAGNRTGIGRYTEHLIEELAAFPQVRLAAAAFTLRQRGFLADLPPEVHPVHRPAPARLLHQCWQRTSWPPAEWITGRSDIVHGTNFVLPPPRRAAGVVTVHDLSYLRYPDLVSDASLAYRKLVPRALQRAAMVITPSRAVAAEVMSEYGVPADRIRATPLGVSDVWFQPVPKPSRLHLPDRYLVAVGTLEPRKGLDVLLDAYRMMLSDGSMPPLVLVGGKGWGPQLATTGIPANRLWLTGYLGEDELRGVVAGAEMLIFPSHYEGFGLPPLEALAAGTAVVASDIPAVSEATAGAGSVVTLVPPQDSAALAHAIATRLARRVTPTEIERGRAHAAEFTWRRCAEQTLSVYRAALG